MVEGGRVSIKQRGIELGQVIGQCLELGHTELELHQSMAMRRSRLATEDEQGYLLTEEGGRGREHGGTHTGGEELMVGSQ